MSSVFGAIKVGVWDCPLNIYTYNSCQKEFPKDIGKILQSYTIACVSISTSKMDFKSMGIYYSTLEMVDWFQTLVQ